VKVPYTISLLFFFLNGDGCKASGKAAFIKRRLYNYKKDPERDKITNKPSNFARRALD
jgi:hypothetical protein